MRTWATIVVSHGASATISLNMVGVVDDMWGKLGC
jgi:hypothetical protein